MAQIAFKKGSVSNLPSTYTEGTFYVTTDERAMYLDVSNSARIRLGDYQEFETLAALEANVNPSTTALYYVKAINCLAKWNGTSYIQINRDSGMTSLEVTGTGNAITAAVYDANGRKLTLTKGATFATREYVGEIPSGYTETSIVAYINKKAEEVLQSASGGSSESAASVLGALNTYKTSNDARVGAIENKLGTIPDGKTVVSLIAEAQEAAEYDDTEITGKVNTLIGSDTGKSVRTIATEELAAQLIPANASASLNELTEIAAWIQAHPGDAAAMNAAITALQNKVNTGNKNVATYVSDAIAALNIGDYATAANLTALAGRVSTLESATHTHSNKTVLDGITAAKVSAWDAAESNAKTYADNKIVEAMSWGNF